MTISARTGLVAFLGCTAACGPASTEVEPRIGAQAAALTGDEMLEPQANDAGRARTVTTSGSIDTGSDFFRSLGTNGRTCNSCHLADQGWTITPAGVQALFEATGGTDPLFAPHDGANSPNADVSTVEARRAAYSLLLSRGLIRVGLPMRDTFEFTLVAVDDPYGFASSAQLSMFRRPLPTANLRFVTVLNWDGRSTPAADLTNIRLGLKNQSNGATVNHARAAAPIADDVRERIVDTELSFAAAQEKHRHAGTLGAAGATGGPELLLSAPFAYGLNDPASPEFTRNVFDLFDAWQGRKGGGTDAARAAVADGQRVFNEKRFGNGGTCSGCHTMPNVGGSSSFRFFDVGVSAASRRRADVPLYTFANKATGETLQTTDPGRALISGRWADMSRFKVPGLRNLAARAPYFHDGSAGTLADVVDHYERRFGIAFEGAEKAHLVAFLESL